MNLNTFYKEKIVPKREVLNKRRKILYKSNTYFFRALVPAILIIFLLKITNWSSFSDIFNRYEYIFTTLIIIYSAIGFILYMFNRLYRRIVKREILAEIIKYIHPSFKYVSMKNGRKEFNESKLFGRPQHVKCDDAFEGVVNGNKVGIYELDCYNKTSSGGGGGAKTTIFKGLYMVSDVSLSQEIEVLPRAKFSTMFKMNLLSNKKNVSIDDDEFGVTFKVFAEKRNTTNLLTEEIKKIMIKKQRTSDNFHFSIRRNKMYVAIEKRLYNYFEMDIGREIDKNMIKKLVIEVVEHFNLMIELIKRMEEENEKIKIKGTDK